MSPDALPTNFGGCCKDLSDALSAPQKSFFFMETNGVFYLTVGVSESDRGKVQFLDIAVMFCPFCGTQLQTKDGVKEIGFSDLQRH